MVCRRAWALSSSIACWLGRPAGASSSHSARPRQESKPESGESARSGSPSTARTDGPQRQPAFTIWLAALRARSFSSEESFSNPSSSVPAAACNTRAESSAVCGSLMCSARASPRGLGRHASPGRTNAKSSSTSYSALTGRAPKREVTNSAWQSKHVAARDQIAGFALRDLAHVAGRRGEPCAAAGNRKRRQFQMRQTQSNLARSGRGSSNGFSATKQRPRLRSRREGRGKACAGPRRPFCAHRARRARPWRGCRCRRRRARLARACARRLSSR